MSALYYESDRALSEYLLFHYGTVDQILPYQEGPQNALNYPSRCVSECLDETRLSSGARALDLGCAVGRASFELARRCDEVVGIDASEGFITVASYLQKQGSITYAFVEEGDATTPATAVVPPEIDRQRVHFEQGDAQQLRSDLGTFQVVLMANLIDRLQDPRQCLAQLPGLLASGGQLILTSPYTWLEEYTPKDRWLGGYEKEGHMIKSLECLREILGGSFELVATKDLPFLIREHARKFQWSVAQASHWIRK